MIAVYLFYLVFTIQILVLSAVHPQLLLRRARLQMQKYPQEQYPQLYPLGVATIKRILRCYRALNWVIVFVGLLFLAGFYRYMQQPDWDDGPVETGLAVYFFIQLIPMLLSAVAIGNFNKSLWQNFAGDKQTALLQRRRLFDFISPVVVILTALLYPLFILLVIYIQQNPFPGFAGYINILFVTLLYLFLFGYAWIKVYGRKENPYLSHGARLHNIGVHVKIAVYTCLAGVTFLALNFMLALNGAQSYEPLAQSLFLVGCAMLYFIGLSNSQAAWKLDIAHSAN
jgi:hypothetical protein